MIKTTLIIDGMMCGMCESHVNDTIRNSFKIKKVTSSHSKGVTEIISEKALVQRLLQHSSAAVTQRYIGIEPQRIEKAIQNHTQLL